MAISSEHDKVKSLPNNRYSINASDLDITMDFQLSPVLRVHVGQCDRS